ncbi:hypothetical protein CBR_g45707 [Chara braunii]|uniref:UDP-N-acetylglucosamine diphosphorylase n=1 Tax=Chara braunii TaxID=69332 RepID=A0A388K3L4_CHABU|nr:hypothetical protein CBR_g45707 [Chara braunii]|eukprot:GBG64652.1 hypothetical protein CBR_g45707 [Chara braunii]
MIEQANKHRRPSQFAVGDLVWVKSKEFAPEESISQKLLPAYRGPWQVLDVIGDVDGPSYVIEIPPHLRTYPVFHASKLLPCVTNELFQSRRSAIPPSMDGKYDVDKIVVESTYHTGRRGRPQRQYKETVSPVPNVVTLEGRSADDIQRWRELGLRAIASGELAVLLLAGGQGTRLGSSQPKGCYDIGLPSRKCLFHLQAERISRVQKMAANISGQGQTKIPWFIMTSEFTHTATVSYFQRHGYFGLDPSQVLFFLQGKLPCLDENGKIILEKPYKIARAPDGNGGLYTALKTSGSLSEMERRGVRYVDGYCVDNALVRVADPVYLGLSIERGAVCASKVVRKAHPEERVGVFAQRGVGGPTVVVEYSELDKSLAHAVDPQTGRLLFNWSNICIHLYSLDFLKRVVTIFEEHAKYHVAKKAIPCVDGTVFGVKLERFIFDAFVYAPCLTLMEVEREEEFAAVKNPAGSPTESPEIACRKLLKMHGKWVIAAGGRLEWGKQENGDHKGSETGWGVELDPLLSHAGEDLEMICKGKVFEHLSQVNGRSG